MLEGRRCDQAFSPCQVWAGFVSSLLLQPCLPGTSEVVNNYQLHRPVFDINIVGGLFKTF